MEISSREGLARALRSADAKERQSVLTSLDKAFEEAREKGLEINQEALDELYRCYSEDGIDRSWYAYLLLSLRNRYSAEVAKREFLATRNNKLLLLAATHIARFSREERLEFLAPLLMDSNNAARCRAAANMVDDCFDRLEPHAALRAAIVSDHGLPLPALNDETLDIWMHELQGPYPRSAEKALLQSGDEGLRFMLTAWERLSPPARLWLLRTATARRLDAATAPIRQTLRESGDRDLLVAALEGVKALELDSEELVTPLCNHPDPLVRATAVATGRAQLNWPERFSTEEAESVRLAILDQVDRCGDSSSLDFLIGCLRDPSWRVRAGATDLLVALAPASLEPLRQALADNDERVRVAAAKGLYRLGREDWVETDLHATQNE